MEDSIRKADILIEALKYIQSFNGKAVVIKYGGAALTNETIRKNVLQDIVFLNYVGIRPVLVHGGGPYITKKLKELGKEAVFANGFRVTDHETIEVVEDELAKINREIVRELIALGGSAISLSGKDDRLIEAKKHADVGGHDIGLVGDITRVNADIVQKMLVSDIIPVISPLAVGAKDGYTYNVNADQAAAEVASALHAAKLVFLTDVGGLLRDVKDPASRISHATVAEAEGFIESGIAVGGMVPKLTAATRAVKRGVKKVHILDVNIPHALLLEIFTDKGIGTEIVKN